jgi:hypothetical protein
MALTTLLSAIDILNRVAAEVGVAPVADPYASVDPSFVKMQYLLNIAGEELLQAHPWEFLIKEHQIVTQAGDTGVYDLPDDFGYMINQTGWERSQQVPLGGPVTAQDWAYLKAQDTNAPTLYVSFRISEGKFNTHPAPPPEGLTITFQYVSTRWVRSSTLPYTYFDAVSKGSQTPMYDRTLISRYVKVKYLESLGFDTTKAQDDFTQCFSFLTGKDKGAAILDAGNSGRNFQYIGGGNVPITGFGM